MKRINRMNTGKAIPGFRHSARVGADLTEGLSARVGARPGSRKSRGLLLALVLPFASLAHGEVTAKDAWVRGTVPAQTATGAFMTFTSTAEAKIVGVASPAAKSAEIHESMMHGGVNHMHEVESVALPAGKAVQFKPGGHHVMLMGLSKPLKPGDTVPLTFTIEEKGGKRTRLEVKAEVRPIGAK